MAADEAADQKRKEEFQAKKKREEELWAQATAEEQEAHRLANTPEALRAQRLKDAEETRLREEARKMEERYGAPTSFADRYKGR